MGVLFAFTTLATWALADLIAKHVLSKKTIWFLAFWGQFLGGIAIILLGLLTGEIQHMPSESWLWIATFSVMNVFGMFTFYKAIQKKGVALSLPLVYSWSIPSVFLGMIFLQEYPSPLQYLGITAAILGIFLVSIEPHKKCWMDKGTLIAFLSMLTWGLFYFLLREPSESYGEWWLAGSLKIATALLCLPFLFRESTSLSTKMDRNFLAVASIGILDALGLIAISLGFQLSTTAVVTGITSTTPVFVAFFGVLLFKEKVNRQQTLGIFSTAFGLVLLVKF